jgi:hypothetical protein
MVSIKQSRMEKLHAAAKASGRDPSELLGSLIDAHTDGSSSSDNSSTGNGNGPHPSPGHQGAPVGSANPPDLTKPHPGKVTNAIATLQSLVHGGGLAPEHVEALTAVHDDMWRSVNPPRSQDPEEQDPKALNAEHQRMTDEADDNAPSDKMKSAKPNPLTPAQKLKGWAKGAK